MGDLSFESGRQILRDGHQGRTLSQVLHIQIGFVEGTGDLYQQPAPIGRHTDPGPEFLFPRLVDQPVAFAVGAQTMEVDASVIVLFPGWNDFGGGIAGVVEPTVVGEPRQGCRSGAGDPLVT